MSLPHKISTKSVEGAQTTWKKSINRLAKASLR